MSSSKETIMENALKEFTAVLKSVLPLGHFSQFYQEHQFDKLAKQKSKEILLKVQANSELDVDETMAISIELYPQFQEIIERWKVKNDENKAQCDIFLQNQVDFLLTDFRTSAMIQLILAPDVRLEDLETFLEGRKIVLIDIFEKLSKLGEPQSSVKMKTTLGDKMECLKMETLEKQRVHLERMKFDKGNKVLEDVKAKIMKKARQLKSDVIECLGNYSKDFVRGTLADIDCYLNTKGKILNEYFPKIFSAILRTTAEVRKCLNEKDYDDMSAVEFAETLHEQLQFDFAGEIRAERNPCAMELDLIGPSDERASEFSGREEELLTVHDESENCDNEGDIELPPGPSLPNELQFDSAVEGALKEENDDEVDLDIFEMDLRNSNDESALTCSGGDGGIYGISEVERGNEVEESTIAFDDKQISCVKPNKSEKRVSKKKPHYASSSRRSARLQLLSQPLARKCSGQKRPRIAADAKKRRNDEYSGSRGENSEDPTADDINERTDRSPPTHVEASSSKSQPSRSKLHSAGRRGLTIDDDRPSADKITYLHLQRGVPYYRCNVCKRKCRQGLLKYHGEFCGKSDDPFACKECGKACVSRAELEMHSRVHTGEKPFKCSKCPTRFAQHSHMLRHMRSHDLAGRFLCKPCKLAFVSAKELHIHNKKKHMGKLPFGCFYCDRRFRRLDELKAHVIVHTDERPYQCPTCGIHYAMKQVLRCHLNSVHNRSRQTAIRLANQSALDYLRREMKDQSFGRNDSVPCSEINMLVASHIIKKAKLRIPEGIA